MILKKISCKFKLLKSMSIVFIFLSITSAANADQTINDPENDVSIPCIDVISTTSSLSGEVLTVTFRLKDVPSSLTFNRTGVSSGYLEYSWSVLVDIDNNSKTGTGDITGSFNGIEYSLSAMHFATSLPTQNLPISQGTQVNTWEGSKYFEKASIVVDDQANTITLSGRIPGISSQSVIYFSTYDYNPGGSKQKDTGGIGTPEPSGGTSALGDVNGIGGADLTDAILALRILAGISVTDTVNLNADVNGDKKIGMEEVIYILQKVSGLRP